KQGRGFDAGRILHNWRRKGVQSARGFSGLPFRQTSSACPPTANLHWSAPDPSPSGAMANNGDCDSWQPNK
ncbi:MAG TPA: hypothetical protein VIH54_13020, partial [Chthoniobacterales bacterium]